MATREYPWALARGARLSTEERADAVARLGPDRRCQRGLPRPGAPAHPPYFAAEHSIAHLGLPEELRGNVEFRYFEASHMMYVHEPSRLAQSAQLAEFVSPAG